MIACSVYRSNGTINSTKTKSLFYSIQIIQTIIRFWFAFFD
nr:MAG TPA: hypothetical protein [Caudoviricetes sp.]